MWILGLKGLSEDVLSGARQPEVMRFPLIICPYSYSDDFASNFGQKLLPKNEKVHFRLRCVAQKCICISSLMMSYVDSTYLR